MERLLLDAQTVQNLSFHESVGVSELAPATIVAALAVTISTSSVVGEGISEMADSGGGGGGGGGSWEAVFTRGS